jgi:hypothetical protein
MANESRRDQSRTSELAGRNIYSLCGLIQRILERDRKIGFYHSNYDRKKKLCFFSFFQIKNQLFSIFVFLIFLIMFIRYELSISILRHGITKQNKYIIVLSDSNAKPTRLLESNRIIGFR